MKYQTANLIMGLSFGLLEASLIIHLALKIIGYKSDYRSKRAATFLGGIFPSFLVYVLSLVQALFTNEKIQEIAVIMVFMAGIPQIIGFLISIPVSMHTKNLKNYQAFLAGSAIPFVLWFLFIYAMATSDI